MKKTMKYLLHSQPRWRWRHANIKNYATTTPMSFR